MSFIRRTTVRTVTAAGIFLLSGTACVAAESESTGTAAGTVDKSTNGEHPALVPARPKKKTYPELHESFLQRKKEGPIELLFLGDSITERWTSAPAVWKKYYGEKRAANFGVGGDRTQNVLWRIESGELDGLSPKVLVLMIGTNNANNDPPEPIAEGIKRIVERLRAKLPSTKILLLGIFPRGPRKADPDNKAYETVKQVNKLINKLGDREGVRYLDIGPAFMKESSIPKDVMPDQVHLSDKGYEIWAESIAPVLDEMM